MVFPDYYFFAERYLVNHTIEKKRVNNLDDCELMCYLNDDCVSLNFKKDSEDNKPGHTCELNNATHMKCQVLLSWLEGELQIDFSKFSSWNNIITIVNVYAKLRALDHPYLVASSIQSLHPLSLFYFSFFFYFRTLVTRVPTAITTQLASLGLHSRDIGTCVLRDSRENVAKWVWVYVSP